MKVKNAKKFILPVCVLTGGFALIVGGAIAFISALRPIVTMIYSYKDWSILKQRSLIKFYQTSFCNSYISVYFNTY